MRYKTWRSNKDKEVHLLCAEGADAFEALPPAIRNLGPWTGSREGEVEPPTASLSLDADRARLHDHLRPRLEAQP
jgi:hypothetical protein